MIGEFVGQYRWLSNFGDGECRYGPYTFPHVENAYQFAKLPKELMSARVVKVFQALDPGAAKTIGGIIVLRPDWEDIKLSVMKYLIDSKFSHKEMAIRLGSTGTEELVEGNWWHDNFWGNCLCTNCRSKPGLNHLGKLLMQKREKLRTP